MYLKDAEKLDRIKDRMVENVLLIWLDDTINESSTDCQNTLNHLRRVVNNVSTFTDGQKCMQFVENIADEKTCMIISASLGQHIVPHLHHLAQVYSIFIFCGNKQYHKEWTKDWSKIKGVFTDIGSICETLKQVAQRCEHNSVSISLMSAGDVSAKTSRNQLDPSFMYTQLMKEILFTINFEQQHIDEFIQHCRKVLAGNEMQLIYVNELARKYRKHTPIWWYTCECFLYPMLNRALRTMDTDLMIKLGFFINDLHRHIEQLHQRQFSSPNCTKHFTVYRGQGMEKESFQKMVVNKGGLISFNSFFSTSKNQSIALNYVRHSLMDDQLIGVLFVMAIDPTRSNTPFASVIDVGYFGAQEDEVLFSMHTVFRIGEITSIEDNPRLFQVQLVLTSDKDNDLRQLIDRIREETFPDVEGCYRLGLVLRKIGEPGKAQRVYEMLLGQKTEDTSKAPIYNQLGVIKDDLGKYAEAIEDYKKSIEIEEKQIPRRNQNLASSYNNIGLTYYKMGHYPKALSFYEKALVIQQQSLSPNDFTLAKSYGNIGNAYFSMGDYAKALSFHEKALAIQQQSLHLTHPDLAATYNNIGTVYKKMCDYAKALSSFEKALIIQEKSLSSLHPSLATSYINIGLVYYHIGNYSKALSTYETALIIQQKSLHSAHPDLAISYNNIGLALFSMGDYFKALSSHEKALIIRQQSLPPTHLDLSITHNNIGVIYETISDYSKAHWYLARAVDIAQHSLPANHPDLQKWQNNLANIKKKLF